MSRWTAAVAATLVLAGSAAACGADGDGEAGESTTLTVYAAASLASSFEDLGARFEETHDGVEVRFSFAGSSDLVAQIRSGAPADVFASADEATMDKLTADGLDGTEPELFASNTLRIAVPPDNPADVRSLQDLAGTDLTLVVCAPEVPCGAATRAVAEAAGIELRPDSEEQSVTDVLGKVVSGEADAGLVYATDVTRAGDDVRGIDFPEAESVVNHYPIATVADSEHPVLARQFVDLVLSDAGQRVLTAAGFDRP